MVVPDEGTTIPEKCPAHGEVCLIQLWVLVFLYQ